MEKQSLDKQNALTRRDLIRGSILGAAATVTGLNSAMPTKLYAAKNGKSPFKAVFIQFTAHTVPAAWSKGIKEVLEQQKDFSYQLLDGQAKADIQISLMNTAINEKVDVIFLQPVDSVGIAPSIKKAKRKGISVITLNIDATTKHAAHIEMNHYYGAIDIAQKMGEMMNGQGEVGILNAPPGIIIRDLRQNGFIDGMKKYHPNIKIVANQSAAWSRKKAQDVFSTMLTANKNITGVYGVNDSMALGAVDVAKSKGILHKMTIFGNDGEKSAIESIEAKELSGTQYTDVYQQSRFAASAATVLATGGISAQDFHEQGHLLMPYTIVTKANASSILPHQRW